MTPYKVHRRNKGETEQTLVAQFADKSDAKCYVMWLTQIMRRAGSLGRVTIKINNRVIYGTTVK